MGCAKSVQASHKTEPVDTPAAKNGWQSIPKGGASNDEDGAEPKPGPPTKPDKPAKKDDDAGRDAYAPPLSPRRLQEVEKWLESLPPLPQGPPDVVVDRVNADGGDTPSGPITPTDEETARLTRAHLDIHANSLSSKESSGDRSPRRTQASRSRSPRSPLQREEASGKETADAAVPATPKPQGDEPPPEVPHVDPPAAAAAAAS